MTSLKTEQVSLTVADGTAMRAYVAHPEGTPRAGMMVFQEAFGVNGHIREVTERFAKEGYLAIAPELFHRSAKPGFEGNYADFASIQPHIKALTNEGLEADIAASFDWLRKTAKSLPIAAIGYCMGGRTACLAGIVTQLACTISYYGGGIGPSAHFPDLIDRLKHLKAPLLMFWGGKDKHIGPEVVGAVTTSLRAAAKPFINVEMSEADHGFFCNERPSYNADASAQAWAMTLSFLDTQLKDKKTS